VVNCAHDCYSSFALFDERPLFRPCLAFQVQIIFVQVIFVSALSTSSQAKTFRAASRLQPNGMIYTIQPNHRFSHVLAYRMFYDGLQDHRVLRISDIYNLPARV
jgi:hypothetical protein